MYQLNVGYGSMLTLFAGSQMPQPFRGQRNVEVCVDFEEYKRFVGLIASSKFDWLFISKDMYTKALSSKAGDLLLRKLFYFDLSRAVLGEVSLAMMAKSDCTFIHGVFNSESSDDIRCANFDMCRVYVSDMDNAQEAEAAVVREVQKCVAVNGGTLNTAGYNAAERNRNMLSYAVFLRALSKQKEPNMYEIKGGF